jgi:hypothetical protein
MVDSAWILMGSDFSWSRKRHAIPTRRCLDGSKSSSHGCPPFSESNLRNDCPLHDTSSDVALESVALTFEDNSYTVDLPLNTPRPQRRSEIT